MSAMKWCGSLPGRMTNHNVSAMTPSNTSLPELSADEQAHAARVQKHVADRIAAAGGWISFADYMALALYAPGLGYYSVGTHKLGAGGDFITAPELTPLFSRCLARQVADVLQTTGGDVLELGAGSGAMAADLLLELEQQQRLPARYLILEVSADLRARQRACLAERVPHLLPCITWLDELPAQFVGCLLANEVLDALPVHRFVMQQGEMRELGVAQQDNQFVWQTRPASTALQAQLEPMLAELAEPLPDGYVGEVNLQLPDWIHSLATAMQRGAMIFIDYGHARRQYYDAARTRGTLNCFHRHRQHDDPFVNPGLQDITAWVDFTALAEAGVAAQLTLCGYTTQTWFLLGCGLEQLLTNMHELPDQQRWQVSQQVQKLTMPHQMGETFKVMAFTKECELPWRGFALRDLRERL